MKLSFGPARLAIFLTLSAPACEADCAGAA
jgi:hypothetical protein